MTAYVVPKLYILFSIVGTIASYPFHGHIPTLMLAYEVCLVTIGMDISSLVHDFQNLFEIWTQTSDTFPLCISPSQMSLDPQKSAVFLDLAVRFELYMVEF